MADSPLNFRDFAAQIKDKYPMYSHMDDFDLASQVVTKYPVYKDRVDLITPISPLGPASVGYGSTQRAANAPFVPPKPLPFTGTAPEGSVEARRNVLAQKGLTLNLDRSGQPVVSSVNPETAEGTGQPGELLLKGLQAGREEGIQTAGEFGAKTGGALANFLVNPTNKIVTDAERRAHPTLADITETGQAAAEAVGRSGGRFIASQAADPFNLALMGAGTAGKVGQTALTGTFAAQTAYGTYEGAKQLADAWDRSDISREQKIEMGADIVINAGMAGLMGYHTVRTPFLPEHPILNSIPPEDRAAVAEVVNKRAQAEVKPELSTAPAENNSPFKEQASTAVLGVGAEPPRGPMPGTVTERRQTSTSALRAKIEDMSPAEKDEAIAQLRAERGTSEKTGLPNYKAFTESEDALAESHPHVGYADIDDFKSFNTRLGHKAVDEKVLPTVGKFLQNAAAPEGEAVKVFHRSGDEFLFRASDPEALSRTIDRFNNSALKEKGVGLSYGIGETEDAAERAAGTNKQERKAAGIRIGSRDVTEVTAEAPKVLASSQPSVTMPGSPPVVEGTKMETQSSAQIGEKARNIAASKAETASNYKTRLQDLGTELDKAQTSLALAQNAQKKGLKYGSRTPEQMAEMEGNVKGLKDQYLDTFRTYIKASPEAEAHRVISELEAPAFDKIGKVMQLQKMLRDDANARMLRRALAEDRTKEGLSEEVRQVLRKTFPGEEISDRLSKGTEGQKNTIRRWLGEMVTPEDRAVLGESKHGAAIDFQRLAFNPSSKIPRVTTNLERMTKGVNDEPILTKDQYKAEYKRAYRKNYASAVEELKNVMPADIAAMAKELKLPEGATRYQVAKKVVKGISKEQAKNAEPRKLTDTEKEQAKALIPRLQESLKNLQGMEEKITEARKAAQEMRTALNEPEFKPQPQKTAATVKRYDASGRLIGVEKPAAEADPRSEEAKYLDSLLAHPHGFIIKNRIERAPKFPVSEESPLGKFISSKLPGTIHEISADNIEHVVGKEFNVRHRLEYSPEEREAIKEGILTKADVARERVKDIRDHYVAEIRKNMELAREARNVKGIQTPSKLEQAIEELHKVPEAEKAPISRQLPEAPAVQGAEKVESAPAPAQEKAEAPKKSTNVLDDMQDFVDKLRKGESVNPATISTLEEKGYLPKDIGNGARADTLQKLINKQRGIEKAAVTRSTKTASATAVAEPRSPEVQKAMDMLSEMTQERIDSVIKDLGLPANTKLIDLAKKIAEPETQQAPVAKPSIADRANDPVWKAQQALWGLDKDSLESIKKELGLSGEKDLRKIAQAVVQQEEPLATSPVNPREAQTGTYENALPPSIQKKRLLLPSGHYAYPIEGNRLSGSVQFTRENWQRIKGVAGFEEARVVKDNIEYGKWIDWDSKEGETINQRHIRLGRQFGYKEEKISEFIKGGNRPFYEAPSTKDATKAPEVAAKEKIVATPAADQAKEQVVKALEMLKKLDDKSLAGIRKELGLIPVADLETVARAVVRSEAKPQPPKPPVNGTPAQEATKPELFGQALEFHKDNQRLEAEISKRDPHTASTFDKLRSVAVEEGTDRVARYSLYNKGLKTLAEGLAKNDPWSMLNAVKAMRKVEERGSFGVPSAHAMSAADIKEASRVYAHMTLSRYEGMTDLQQARFKEKINDGVLARAVKESGDQNVLDRFNALREKVADTDPVSALGTALINGKEVTAAEAGEAIMRNRMGEQKLDKVRLRAELNDYAKRWDKATINESVEFMDNIEKGTISSLTGVDQSIASKLRDLLDDRRTKLQALGQGFLDHYLDNYFPHIWSNVGKARDVIRQILSRRPLAGTSEFLKSREYDTIKAGLAAGLQPMTWNPVKLALARIEQIDKFLAAHKMKQDFQDQGLVQFFRVGANVPDGWVKLEDKIFNASKMDPKTRAVMTFGDYYAPKELAKAFNNHLSPGWTGNKVYDIVRTYGNAVNQANLIGGVFHLIESGFNTTVSDLALSMQQATTKGQRLSALKSLARIPVSVVDAYFISGKRMMAEAARPGTFAEYAQSVDAMKRAGGSLTIDPQYLNQSLERFRTNWKTMMDSDSGFKTRAGAVLRVGGNGVGTLLEKANWFVMEHFVPRMKAATFHRMANQIYDKMGPNANDTALNMELDRAWDSVDNRLGELIYDNMFWNRMVKDLALVTFRSTGWNLGTARELGGGALDIGRNVVDLAKGRKTELSPRTAYTIALTGTVMAIGATMTYFATGHGPQSLTDYFYPQDGTTGPDGKPNRHYLKSYVHDVNSLLQHPLSTLAHKASPLWSQAYELTWANADYYGREIRHPGDSIFQDIKNSGKYLAQSSQPFFWQNFKEEERRDATTSSKFEALFGILPAPKWAGQTKAESLAYDLAMRSMPQGPRDQHAFDRQQEVASLRNKYANEHTNIKDMVGEAREGKIRFSDIENVVKESKQTPLERHLSRLNAKDALSVWDAATPEERDTIRMSVLRKYGSIYKDYEPQEQGALKQQFLEILRQGQQKRTGAP